MSAIKKIFTMILTSLMALTVLTVPVLASSYTEEISFPETVSNEWQIVDELYKGNEISNKTVTSDDGMVRIQKNVIPTDKENEFLVYLAMDAQTVKTVTVTDITEYLENIQVYENYSSNSEGGAEGDLATPKGKKKEDGTRGWIYVTLTYNHIVIGTGSVQAGVPNSTVYLEVGTGKFICLGNFPNGATEVHFDVELTDRAYDALFEAVIDSQETTSEVSALSVESNAVVTDTMGDYITYQGLVSVDGSAIEENGVLTWNLTGKADAPTTTPVVTEVVEGEGTDKKVTRTETRFWSLNVAELVYKVSLNVLKDGFTSFESYNVNNSAQLTYEMDGAEHSAVFPVPAVKGRAFYVYHSADCTVEKIAYSDEYITYGANDFMNKGSETDVAFNLVDETKKDFLYGGHYSAYPGANLTAADQAIARTYTNKTVSYAYGDHALHGVWTDDTDAVPYTYENVASTAWADPSDENGKALSVQPDTIYYLKEVPDHYLRPYSYYTYYKAGFKLADLWAISAVDDLNYINTGFQITGTPSNGSVTSALSIRAANSTKTVTLKAPAIDKEKMVKSGYVSYLRISDCIGRPVSYIQQYWTTPDGVRVYGVKRRSLNGGTTITTFGGTDSDDPTKYE